MSIVYEGGEDKNLWIVNDDGSGKRALTKGGFNQAPRWSPVGGEIAFYGDDPMGGISIYIATTDGKNVRRIATVTNGSGMAHLWLDWSPDGRQIAYSSPKEGANNIYVVRNDGTADRRLTNMPFAIVPSWFPDGQQIAFFGLSASGGVIPFIIRSDGTGLHSFLDTIGSISLPLWSPDGRWLAFAARFDTIAMPSPTFDTYVANAERTLLKRLTFDRHSEPMGWSNDSKSIFILSYHDRVNDIDAMNVETGTRSHLVTIAREFIFPRISRDKRRIAFTTPRLDRQFVMELYVIDTDGSNLIHLADSRPNFDWSPVGLP